MEAARRRSAGSLRGALDVPFVEVDELVHGPNWAETPDEELRARAATRHRLRGLGDRRHLPAQARRSRPRERGHGGLARLAHARLVPAALRRTLRRLRGRELLWNDNPESLRGAFWGRRVAVRLGLPDALRPQAPLSAASWRRTTSCGSAHRARCSEWLERAQPGNRLLLGLRAARAPLAEPGDARRPSQIGVSST